jgi:N6-adenosine-specific RNA methylase IME4
LSARHIKLAIKPIKIWGYDKLKNFVCRLEINAAGVAVYTGETGGQKLCDDSWEKFVKRLKKEKENNKAANVKVVKPTSSKPLRSEKFVWKEGDLILRD